MNAVSFLSVVHILPVRFRCIGVERSMEREINDTDRLGKTFPGQFFFSPSSGQHVSVHRRVMGNTLSGRLVRFALLFLESSSVGHLIFSPCFHFPNVRHPFHIVVTRCCLLLWHICVRLQHQHAATTHARLPNLC